MDFIQKLLDLLLLFNRLSGYTQVHILHGRVWPELVQLLLDQEHSGLSLTPPGTKPLVPSLSDFCVCYYSPGRSRTAWASRDTALKMWP